MSARSDKQLLIDYATRHDDAAFAEIVNRYRDLVYSAALRQVSPADAAEVAQTVFIDLAGKADSVATRLSDESSLAGWLHRGTRFVALKHLRAAYRRVANETQAMQQLPDHHDDDDTDWAHIQPALDEAIDSLPDADREALLLRFFKDLDFRAVGGALGMSDDAAQKRVSRALERLRGFFAQRGITVSVAALTVALSTNAVQAAPIELAVSLAVGAKSAATVAQTLTTTKQLIAMTTLQKGLIAASVAVATVVGVTVYQHSKTANPPEQVAQTPEPAAEASTNPSATDQVKQLNTRIESLASALERARKTNAETIAERDKALRAAAIYKELAERKEKDANGETSLPTHRHYMQSVGQIAASYAALKNTDSSKLSPEEKRALEDEQLKMNIEMLKLVRSAKAKGFDEDSPELNQNQPDITTCFLFGALNLNQDQFTQLYSIISQYDTPSLPIVPKDEKITAERMVVVKQRRAELDRQIEPLLNPEQLTTFKAIQSNLHIINPYDGSVTLGYTWPRN